MSDATTAKIAWGARVPPEFRDAVRAMGERLKLDPSWLMTLMSWETSRSFGYHRDAHGQIVGHAPPWAENLGDGGGGLIGFTAPRGKNGQKTPFHVGFPLIAAKDPVSQLHDVEAYLVRWIAKVGRADNVGDCYLYVRGPYGVGKGDSYPLGGGMTAGRARKIIELFHAEGMKQENLG